MESIPEKNTPVLVVDDDEGLLLSIKATLVSSGLPEPALISDSRQVLDQVHKHSFRLILLDLNIPRIHGLTLLATVKSDPQLKHIPVIVLTASAIEEDIHRAYQLQANSYLSKPTDLSGFRDMIESLESHWLSCAHLPSQPMVDSPAVGESHDLAEPSCGGEAS